MRYRKKPVVIEAIQWTGDNERAMRKFMDQPEGTTPPGVCSIFALEGAPTVAVGDWVIRGAKGGHYPCKPDIFEATYELIKGEK